MRTIETNATVTAEGKLTIEVPPEVSRGEHHVVVVIDENFVVEKKKTLNFPVDNFGPWPKGLSLRREDMYGDDGR